MMQQPGFVFGKDKKEKPIDAVRVGTGSTLYNVV
jgi:hypothetical protein